MRTLSALLFLGLAVICCQNAAVGFEKKDADKKEVTLKGKITCAKCELNVTTDCATVIVVKDDKKNEVVYYFDKKGHEKYHDDTCGAGKDGAVTGTIMDDATNKRKIVVVKEVKYN